MDDLLVECPIHLDAVSVKDILVFKCGHGFCQPCLEEHFAHHGQSNSSCPSCRKPIKRKEAFSLFLTPAYSSTQAGPSSSTAEAAHVRLLKELRDAKAAHANCSGHFIELRDEIDTLRQDDARHTQTIHHLHDRCGLLEQRLLKETEHSAREREENNKLKEETARLHVENHKTSIALEHASKEVQMQLERVKLFQGYVERYKRKCSLERKKRKAVENANHHVSPKKEEESLMVVDANAPDVLHEDGPDFRWLDEACNVRGDRFAISSDDELESKESVDEDVQVRSIKDTAKQKTDQAPKPPAPFPSDWNLALEGSSSIPAKKRHGNTRQVGGSKIVKVKVGSKPVGGPLAIDRHGRIKGAVALGSRQKLSSKN